MNVEMRSTMNMLQMKTTEAIACQISLGFNASKSRKVRPSMKSVARTINEECSYN